MTTRMITPRLPSQEQRDAIGSRAKFLRVIAGPGSGKTHMLASRLMHQMQDYKLSPREVTAITFTRRAADVMRDRICVQSIGESMLKAVAEKDPDFLVRAEADALRLVSQMFVGTLHSWCLHFLRDHGAALGLRTNFTVLDELDHVDIRKALKLKYGEAAIEELYWQHKMGINALDFDDLLKLSVKLFDEHPEVKETMQPVRWLYWDEFQDCCELDYQLLRHMNPLACTIVGDPDQAIYSFRGSSAEYLDRFAEDFPDVATAQLSNNYRSNGLIVRAAQNLIEHNEDRIPRRPCTGMLPVPNGPFAGAMIATAQVSGEWQHDALDVVRNVKLPRESMVLLCRTNRQVDDFIHAATRAGVPTQTLSLQPRLWKDPGARLLLKLLQHIDNPSFTWALEWAVAQNYFKLEAEEWEQIKLGAVKMTAPLWEVARAHPAFAALRAAEDELPEAKERTVDEDLSVLEQHLDTEGFWMLRGQLTRVEAARELRSFAADWTRARVGDFRPAHRRAFLGWSALREQQEEGWSQLPGHLTVATLHAAKGLEWPIVFIAPFQEGAVPHPKAPVDEERRLVYVGVTRAAHLAVLIAPDDARCSRFGLELLPLRDRNLTGNLNRINALKEQLRAELEGHP